MDLDEIIKQLEDPRIDCITFQNSELSAWLQELRARRHYMEKIFEVLAEQLGCPCNFSPIDEYMLESGGCEDCCGEIPDKECWSRYLQTKIVGGSENGNFITDRR